MGSIHLCGVEDQNLKKQVSLIFVIEPASSHNYSFESLVSISRSRCQEGPHLFFSGSSFSAD